ncbi:MAG: ATP-binding protein, partial [Anaerolineae bacterium]
RFRRVISSISDCVYVTQVTENGDYINRYLSPHIEALTGYPLEKFMADWHFWLFAVVHPDDKAAATTNAERLTKGQDTEIEYRMIRADDNVIWVRDSAKIYRSDDGSTIIYGVVSDITERKQAEEALRELNTTLETQVAERTAELQQRAVELEAALGELREAQERLLRSERLAVIGELAGSVAHDLRNPLGVISSSAYYIRRKLTQTGQADERILGSLEQMEKNVVASDRIIRGLLEFARGRPPELRPTDINQAVRSALADAPLPPPNEVAVVTHLAEGLPQIPLDAQQLERVFINLITNAVQAMPERGQLEVRTWRDEEIGNIVVSISDVGEGIPPENMARIFEPLFSTKVHGTGLGLPICQRIVEAHGGSIEVESQVGAGSTFTVRLPLTNEYRSMTAGTTGYRNRGTDR